MQNRMVLVALVVVLSGRLMLSLVLAMTWIAGRVDEGVAPLANQALVALGRLTGLRRDVFGVRLDLPRLPAKGGAN